jgi:hypothetical protein
MTSSTTRNARRQLLPLVSVLAVGVGISVYATAQHHFASGRAKGSPEALTREVRELQGQVQALQSNARPQVVYVSAPVEPVATTQPKAEEPPDAEPVLEPAERQLAAAADLRARFESQPVDRAWSSAATRELQESLARSTPSTRVLQVDCATSLCRVVLAHDSEDDQRALAGRVAAETGFKEGVFYDYTSTETALSTTLFVLREGHSFRG